MRHSATRSLLERDDVIIVASVSSVGIGSVETYAAMTFKLQVGDRKDPREVAGTSSPCNTSAMTMPLAAALSA